MISRRDFLATIGAAGAAALAGRHAFAAPGDIKVGYAAITWEGNDLKAIEEVAAVGFKGIQLRSPIMEKFGDSPGALKDLLAKHRLTMVALSSGNVRIDPAVEKEEIAKHTANAKFVRDVGGLYLQVTDERPKRAIVPADFERMGKLLTEIGKRTADLGVPLGYHKPVWPARAT